MSIQHHKITFMDKLREKYGRVQYGSVTVDGSMEFDEKYRKEMPVRFFLLETLPTFLTRSNMKISEPFKSLKFAIFYRTLGKFHVVNTGLPPGYHDKDQIMLYANFSLLVDFVEIEYSHGPSKEEAKANKSLRKIRWKMKWIPAYHLVFRSAELGVNELKNRIRLGEMEIDEIMLENGELPEYAKHMQESIDFDRTVLELYHWWTVQRPAQIEELESIEPMSEFRQAVGKDNAGGLGILSKKLEKKYPEAFKKVKDQTLKKHQLEKLLKEEDQEMLTKLIGIRTSLWT